MTRALRATVMSLTLASCIGLNACHDNKPAETARPPVNVDAIQVSLRDVPVLYEYVGQTESSQQVEIRSRVNGFLDRRVYHEGAFVHEGDVMFLMDPKPFEAQLDAAKAEYAQQKARLDTAQANLNRVRPLVAKNALSQKDLDDTTGQQQAAAAALEQARANVTTAQLNLSYATIKAPVTGLSSFAKRQDGSYIDASNSLLTYVAKLDPMWINFSLSENEMLLLRTEVNNGSLKLPPLGKLEAVIVMADGSIYPQRGRIAFTDASLSSETGTYLIRAEVPNPNGALRPGQFVRITLAGALRTSAIAVPQGAIQQGARGAFVWTVGTDSKAQQRAIESGAWNGSDWIVNAGLHAGDQVILDNTLKLMPGAPVKVNLAPAPESKAIVGVPPGGAAGGAGGGANGAGGGAAGAGGGAGGGTAAAGGGAAAAGGGAAGAGGGAAAAGAGGTAAAGGGAAPAGGGAAGAGNNAGAAPAGGNANAAATSAGRTALYFNTGSASLDQASADALAAVAKQLVGSPDTRVAISGYTDATGSYEDNVKLAAARAQTVRSALIVAGVADARIEMRRPAKIVANDAPDKSRRVDVTLSRASGG